MNAIAAKTGHQYEYQGVVAADVFTALTGNTADIACTSLGANNQRRSLGIAFTSAIFTNPDGILVLATDTREYTAVTDFAGQPVGTITGTVYVPLLQNAGFADARTFATTAEGIAALQRGEINMLLTSSAAFLYQQRVLGQWADIRFVDTYLPVASVYSAIAVRNTDTALLGELQAALEALKADGTVTTLVEKWQLPPPPF